MSSDLGPHYLPMSHKKDARLIWVNECMSTAKVRVSESVSHSVIG